ncbi:MAG: asparagine synthase-related protein [Nitrososphaerota archaeon]
MFIASATRGLASYIHLANSVVEELIRRWPVIDFFLDGQRASLNELTQPFHKFAVIVFHSGSDVVTIGKDEIDINLAPSTVLNDSSLMDSPFFLKVKLGEGVIRANTDNFSTFPLSVVFSEPIITASWNQLLCSFGQRYRLIAPSTELLINKDGLTEIREFTSMNYIHDHSPESLLNLIDSSVRKSVSKRCAILFSGGLDSTLLLKLIMDSGRKVLAISVGLNKSHDLALSEKVAKLIGADRFTVELSQEKILQSSIHIRNMLRINGLMDTSIAVLFYNGALEAASSGIRQLVAGQGADELFGGYKKYLRIYESSGPINVEKVMTQDLVSLWRNGIVRDYSATALAGCLLTLPYLDPDIVGFLKSLPISAKISPPLRKLILRKVCSAAGLPEEVCMYEKKAAQYGSGIEKVLRKAYR